MDEIKYMVIYMDNSCEVHFESNENSKLLLSPCGSEFVYRTFADNLIKNTLKYRTAYAISIFSAKLAQVLNIRNKYCNDRPFVSPILLENENQYWLSPEDLTEPKWNITSYLLDLKNPIEIDYVNFCYSWKSDCKNTQLKLHFNKTVFTVKYPVKIPTSPNDEYENQLQLNSRFKQTNSKHIFKYTFIEQEFSVNHMPPLWEDLYTKMLEIIEKFHSNSTSTDNSCKEVRHMSVCLPEAMPLSCTSTHLHRFDNLEATSEPKVIYSSKTWYKLFYKTKSIEILCPPNLNESIMGSKSTQDYLISDSLTGRYYTCYSLNTRNAELEETKICLDNVPAFKVYLQKTLTFANILLKRISSLNYLSNHPVCFSTNKFKEVDSNKTIPTIAISNLTKNTSNNQTNNETTMSSSNPLSKLNVKKQSVTEDVGHFKLYKNNSVLIHFIDKVRLYMDEYSVRMFTRNQLDKCSIQFYMPDNSQHEILYTEMNSSTHFSKYLSFLNQWLKYLNDNNELLLNS